MIWRLFDPVQVEFEGDGLRRARGSRIAHLWEGVPVEVDTRNLSVGDLDEEIINAERDDFDTTVYRVDRYAKLVAPLGCLLLPAVAFFFDASAGVIMYDGVRFTNVSEPINEKMMTALNRAATFKTTMWLDDNRLYCSIPIGEFVSGSSKDHATQTYVYDLRMKTWSVHSIGFVPDPTQDRPDTLVVISAQDLQLGDYFGGGMADKKGIFRLYNSKNDDGSAISAFMETAWLNPGNVGDLHRLRRLDIVTDSPDGAVIAEAYRNFNDTTAFSTTTFTPTGTLDQFHLQDQLPNDSLWVWLKVKLSNSTVSESFKVSVLGGSFSVRPGTRGKWGGLNQ